MNRRTFLKAAVAATAAAPVAAASYALYESTWVEVARRSVTLPRLPVAFDGTTVAFLADIHHGPFTALDYVASVVRTTLALKPDVVVLGGDYCLRGREYIVPCFDVLSELRAPLGVYGVLGNHDYWDGVDETRAGMKAAGVHELTNRGVWLDRRGDRFRLCGIDDLWMGKRDLAAALGDAKKTDSCLLVSHNPDAAETIRDGRVGLVLSGHTHGGQVVFPGMGPPFVPSAYGTKYLKGFADAPATRVYVSRGLGTTGGPVRVGSRPELTLLTLRADATGYRPESPTTVGPATVGAPVGRTAGG